MTHLLAYNGDRRNLQPALCGTLIDVSIEHAIGAPECEACQRLDDEGCAELLRVVFPSDVRPSTFRLALKGRRS